MNVIYNNSIGYISDYIEYLDIYEITLPNNLPVPFNIKTVWVKKHNFEIIKKNT